MQSLRRLASAHRITCSLLPFRLHEQERRPASQYQRPQQLVSTSDERLQALKAQLFKSKGDMTNDDWRRVQDELLKLLRHINKNNLDATIVGICNEENKLSLAKSYVAYIRSTGVEPNVATLGRLLKCYYMQYQWADVDALDAQEQANILEICTKIRQKYDVLDATTCEYLILGMVTTDQWQDAIELLQMSRLTAVPSVTAYTALIVKAFRMRSMEIGWRILNEMAEDRKQPRCEVFTAYLTTLAEGTGEQFVHGLEQLLQFLNKYDYVITLKVSRCTIDLAQKFPDQLTVHQTKLKHGGHCANCDTELTKVCVSEEEYKQLSDSFLNKVLIRSDVFLKATPEEVQRFKRYVEQSKPYDCVIDGLNVAYSMGAKKSPAVLANLLASVVKYFKNKNKRVLVLGRIHMKKWPRLSMNYVERNACVFLTNNLTHDDPFLLYATIKSGQHTDFFSRDLMRTHAFLLGPELKTIFRRWQQEHQYSLVTQTQRGDIIVREPQRFSVTAHKVHNTWHIPCKLEYSANPAENFDLPETWLCVKFQKTSENKI